MIGFRNGRRGGASFARQPLLDSQVIRIFRLKNRLIILRVASYVIHGRICPGNKFCRPSLWSDSSRVGIRAVVRTRVVRILGPDL